MKVFERIYKANYPTVYEKYKNEIADFSKLYDIRSRLAHSYLELTENEVKKKDKTRLFINQYK